jgi:hypothetical protein
VTASVPRRPVEGGCTQTVPSVYSAGTLPRGDGLPFRPYRAPAPAREGGFNRALAARARAREGGSEWLRAPRATPPAARHLGTFWYIRAMGLIDASHIALDAAALAALAAVRAIEAEHGAAVTRAALAIEADYTAASSPASARSCAASASRRWRSTSRPRASARREA